ncbi:DNA/RNA non-specific endonuclease (plasmid) [Microbacterium hominis]|uniref:DNA/RNA non-specific endonuclease n=1 Tax=Microbacterium hominis TaxID=162426 RepID=UPI001962390B|nr:DNA/RNA non-specific endonuclease [Microbacterium hominis]QRY42308.1 DNA/RNA non-specific endonuclease [Microbacterium hominis]
MGAVATAAAVVIAGWAFTDAHPAAPSPSGTSTTGEGDYYAVLGAAQRLYVPAAAGDVEYCPVDGLGRATCAYGELTSMQRRDAQARGRQEIAVDPAGWGRNGSVVIPAAPALHGSEAYKGWLFNRSHLVADSLGGAAIAANLVTGTRTQNVGSTKRAGEYAGGMAYAEQIARTYLDTGAGDSCPLYYAATPVYQGDELLPRSVLVDLRSCDGAAVDERVKVSNTAYGWSIDYRHGTFTTNP